MAKPEKITRAAFQYMEPEGRVPSGTFAQCSTCTLWNPEDSNCSLMAQLIIDDPDEASCDWYVPGEPAAIESEQILSASEAGFVDRKVQCHRCFHFNAADSTCGGYAAMNKAMPDLFALSTKVKPHGCCSLQTPKRRQ